MTPLEQHQVEIQKNLAAWQKKPLLQNIYTEFYSKILQQIDANVPGAVVEIGSGIGNLRTHFPKAISTDLFPNPWLDIVCDGYEIPFIEGSVSHLVLFDVFHHLKAPRAFLKEAGRVLSGNGKIIIFDPYISLTSYPFYELHHERVNWNEPIFMDDKLPRPRSYYTSQGTSTRLFFRNESEGWLTGWRVAHAEAFAGFRYLLSGGYSKPAVYPAALYPLLKKIDATLTKWPRLFGARCLVVLERE